MSVVAAGHGHLVLWSGGRVTDDGTTNEAGLTLGDGAAAAMEGGVGAVGNKVVVQDVGVAVAEAAGARYLRNMREGSRRCTDSLRLSVHGAPSPYLHGLISSDGWMDG